MTMMSQAGDNDVNHRERDAMIASACRVVKNDLTITQFHGVAEQYVAEIRSKLPKRKTISLKWSNAPDVPIRINDGAVREAATIASRALNERIWLMYEREAEKRGVPPLEIAVAMGMMG